MNDDIESAPRDNPALAWARRTRMADEIFIEVHREVRRRRRRRLGIASAGVVVMTLIAITVRSPNVASLDAPRVTAAPSGMTVVAVPVQQTLPDGSTVELKDDAEIAVEYSVAARRVVLVRGEAHFQVVKDKARAFTVVAGGIEIRAVGTAFSVEVNQRAVDVHVTEGQIAVNPGAGAPGTADPSQEETGITGKKLGLAAGADFSEVVVAKGNRVTVDLARVAIPAAPVVVAVTESDLAERLSWRVPRLRFSGTPLADAIPMFNRHSRVHLVAGDAEVGRLKLSGTLRADDVESLVQLLQMEFGIRSEPRGSRALVLQASVSRNLD